jgi:hypothetical protein
MATPCDSNSAAGTAAGPQTVDEDQLPQWHEDYRAYDWQVLLTCADGRFRLGALGRTDEPERCRARLAEALAALPVGVKAHGEMFETDVLDPPEVHALIEVATRDRDSSITWRKLWSTARACRAGGVWR